MNPLHLPRRAGQLLIVGYQYTLSLDHSPILSKFTSYQVCKFHPTCSEFGYEAVGKYGLAIGSWMTLKRLFRCNPWNDGGHDPVP